MQSQECISVSDGNSRRGSKHSGMSESQDKHTISQDVGGFKIHLDGMIYLFNSQITSHTLSTIYGTFFAILDTHKKCYRRMYQEEIHRIYANSKPFPF